MINKHKVIKRFIINVWFIATGYVSGDTHCIMDSCLLKTCYESSLSYQYCLLFLGTKWFTSTSSRIPVGNNVCLLLGQLVTIFFAQLFFCGIQKLIGIIYISQSL